MTISRSCWIAGNIARQTKAIHYNPVETGFVEKPEDYLYSSAWDYYGFPGFIDILLVDPLIVTDPNERHKYSDPLSQPGYLRQYGGKK